jgi:hypothetical protein
MIKEGSTVHHVNPNIDLARGKMKVIEIKNKLAVCGYEKSSRNFLYLLTELKQRDKFIAGAKPER